MTSPRRVLIAEDEALIRLDLAEMLAEEGFEVVGEAGDGEEAVALAKKLKPDLVILDVKMPKMDGIDAAAQIVSEQIAPVVMLTAFSQRDLIERARDAGAMAYLVKPFSPADLLPAIELAVARYAEMIALREEVSDITERLETRKLVDRAKGLLMTNQKMTEPDAFRWIQRTAMDRRTSMQAVAQAGSGPVRLSGHRMATLRWTRFGHNRRSAAPNELLPAPQTLRCNSAADQHRKTHGGSSVAMLDDATFDRRGPEPKEKCQCEVVLWRKSPRSA